MRIIEQVSYKIECPFCIYDSESTDRIEAIAQAMHHGKQHANQYQHTADGYVPIAYKPLPLEDN